MREKKEEGRERKRERERESEKEGEREREREKERERDVALYFMLNVMFYSCFIFIFKRNDRCLGTFYLSSYKYLPASLKKFYKIDSLGHCY